MKMELKMKWGWLILEAFTLPFSIHCCSPTTLSFPLFQSSTRLAPCSSLSRIEMKEMEMEMCVGIEGGGVRDGNEGG